MGLVGLLGVLLLIVGVIWLISGSLIPGVVLVVIGLFLLGYGGRGWL